MAKRHKHADASVSIRTTLDAATAAEICEQAAKEAETLQVLIRLEDSEPGRLVYSARNRLVGGRIEFMTFEVTLRNTDGGRQLKTRILTYKMKRQWLLLIPMPWQMIAWSNYKKFMYGLQAGIRRADPGSVGNVVELARSA